MTHGSILIIYLYIMPSLCDMRVFLLHLSTFMFFCKFNSIFTLSSYGCPRIFHDICTVIKTLSPCISLVCRFLNILIALGIQGAFDGAGCKTVIPRKVIGKFSIRLVPNMEPATVQRLVVDYINDVHKKRNSPNVVKYVSSRDVRNRFFYLGSVSVRFLKKL